jgi:hypothetical protein
LLFMYVGRSDGKHIADDEAPAAVRLREADALSSGRVVERGIRCRRIDAEEGEGQAIYWDVTLRSVAIVPARADNGAHA